ncbi:hypothetical protein FA09DRAFT_127479 [Tilletiopsis washingtonensis]|uniref:Uncharacterized protein n=1 Tax=Tilletiopsis washingtonensis TaxID=58919 RepID=A0A316Z440_9BASI|nr:hypothetical protein FA09DRAFT_127479 [Tilletiopsis washingtonensis]PWN95844.1 hypothetical protein FA09DRAFT_127479 [Tilletiopsis washingtonensis]
MRPPLLGPWHVLSLQQGAGAARMRRATRCRSGQRPPPLSATSSQRDRLQLLSPQEELAPSPSSPLSLRPAETGDVRYEQQGTRGTHDLDALLGGPLRAPSW